MKKSTASIEDSANASAKQKAPALADAAGIIFHSKPTENQTTKEKTMNKPELAAALALAKSPAKLPPLVEEFDGFAAFGFRPIVTTLANVAALIRWQALQWNGQLDHEALQEIADYGRTKFQIIG